MSRQAFYRDYPFSEAEVCKYLHLDPESYRLAVDGGMLARSCDLSDARPGSFLAHSFWDIVRFQVLIVLLRAGYYKNSHAAIESLLDAASDLLLEPELDLLGSVQLFDRLVSSTSVWSIGQNERVCREMVADWLRLERHLSITALGRLAHGEPCSERALTIPHVNH